MPDPTAPGQAAHANDDDTDWFVGTTVLLHIFSLTSPLFPRSTVPEHVNPITGKLWPAKDASREAAMTEEEKEVRAGLGRWAVLVANVGRQKSAEELMHLIRRLNANGIIKCQLPEGLDQK